MKRRSSGRTACAAHGRPGRALSPRAAFQKGQEPSCANPQHCALFCPRSGPHCRTYTFTESISRRKPRANIYLNILVFLFATIFFHMLILSTAKRRMNIPAIQSSLTRRKKCCGGVPWVSPTAKLSLPLRGGKYVGQFSIQ